MKSFIIIAIIAFAGYYYFNNRKPQCETLDDVANKGLELTQAFIHAATAKNSNISTERLVKEIKNIEVMKKNGFPDIQKACQAIDNLMGALD